MGTVHGKKKQQTSYRSSAFDTDNNNSSDFADAGLIQLRKFRQLKTMILFLQENPVFGKYCYYGCWCFVDGSDNLQTGYGKPRDNMTKRAWLFPNATDVLLWTTQLSTKRSDTA